MISKRNLANQSLFVEQANFKRRCRITRSSFAAFGGFNVINFKRNSYEVNPVLNLDNIKKLEENLVLVYSGLPRNAKNIEKEKRKILEKIKFI